MAKQAFIFVRQAQVLTEFPDRLRSPPLTCPDGGPATLALRVLRIQPRALVYRTLDEQHR